MKTSIRALVALATATVLALGTTTSAHAATHIRSDARNDVVRINPETWAQQPATPGQGDLRRLVVDHRDGAVVVVARFDALKRGQQAHIHVLSLRTGRIERNTTIIVDPDSGAQGETSFTDANENEVACDGLVTRVRWADNLVRVRVPRTCLNDPGFVRAGYGYLRVTPRGVLFGDEAYRKGSVGATTLQYGPRVYRG